MMMRPIDLRCPAILTIRLGPESTRLAVQTIHQDAERRGFGAGALAAILTAQTSDQRLQRNTTGRAGGDQ